MHDCFTNAQFQMPFLSDLEITIEKELLCLQRDITVVDSIVHCYISTNDRPSNFNVSSSEERLITDSCSCALSRSDPD